MERTLSRVGRSFATLPASFFFLSLCALAPSASAQDLEAGEGFDLFVTDAGTTDLLGIPFQGVPLSPPTYDFPGVGRRAIADTDTIVHRLETATVPGPGMSDEIQIELVLLSLVSQTADYMPDATPDGPIPPLGPGPLYVTLQTERGVHPDDPPPGPPSLGDMEVTFDSANGGTFHAEFTVFADLRFGAPDGPIVCDGDLPPCADFDAGFPLATEGDTEWGRVPPSASVRIQGANRHLAGAGDTSADFWAGVPPGGGEWVCVAHGGHPDPGGAPTAHGTCGTPCTTVPLTEGSGCDGQDSNCDGIIDDCPEDVWNPDPVCPPNFTLECGPVNDVRPEIAGFGVALDDCNPAAPIVIEDTTHTDFITPRCGRTFDVDRLWHSEDACGNDSVCLQQIFVVDTTPPQFEVEDGPQFEYSVWPPGHGYAVWSIEGLVSVTDGCGEATVAISGCHSSQPENVRGRLPGGGSGDGNTVEDCVISEDGQSFAVRRERLGGCGPDSSRTYTIILTAKDECGNTAQSEGYVHVEHDRSNHVPLDDTLFLAPNEPPPWPYVHPTTYGPDCGD